MHALFDLIWRSQCNIYLKKYSVITPSPCCCCNSMRSNFWRLVYVIKGFKCYHEIAHGCWPILKIYESSKNNLSSDLRKTIDDFVRGWGYWHADAVLNIILKLSPQKSWAQKTTLSRYRDLWEWVLERHASIDLQKLQQKLWAPTFVTTSVSWAAVISLCLKVTT